MKNRKYPLYSVFIFLLALFCLSSGCVGGDAGEEAQAPAPSLSVETADDGTIIISGAGDQKTAIPLTAGVHLMTLDIEVPDGEKPRASAVSITTKKEAIMVEGTYSDEAFSDAIVDGRYRWTYAFMLEDDANAEIGVSQQAPWTLSFGFPEMINGIPPQSFSGIGNMATPFFMIPAGDYTCTITAEKATFINAWLMDYDGTILMDGSHVIPLPFHELRNDDEKPGARAYSITVPITSTKSDNYLFNIISDGSWSVSIS